MISLRQKGKTRAGQLWLGGLWRRNDGASRTTDLSPAAHAHLIYPTGSRPFSRPSAKPRSANCTNHFPGAARDDRIPGSTRHAGACRLRLAAHHQRSCERARHISFCTCEPAESAGKIRELFVLRGLAPAARVADSDMCQGRAIQRIFAGYIETGAQPAMGPTPMRTQLNVRVL